MANDLPYFPFYINDFTNDENVKVMDLSEVGLYVMLLCHQWREGSIPADEARLARLVRLPIDEFQKVWPAVKPCFSTSTFGDGRLMQPRLEIERAIAIDRQEKRRLGGRTTAANLTRGDTGKLLPRASLSGTEQDAIDKPSKRLASANTESDIDITDSLRSSAPKPKKAVSDAERDAWVLELRTAIAEIADTPIKSLTLEERLLVGRYHVYRFANCNRSLAKNRTAGAKAAVAFAKMASSKLYADLTVRGYVDEAAVYHKTFMGEAPFFDPFAIRAVAEPEAVR